MPSDVRIGQRLVGEGHPVFIVAELSANHHQRLESAIKLVHAARAAGADAVKLQTYTADTLTIRSDHQAFRVGPGTSWAGRYLHDLYSDAATPWEWYKDLREIARECGLEIFSTPFDDSAVEFLEGMNVPAYKIASFELVDLPLLRRVASTGKPIILSTGMATLDEIQEALGTLRSSGAREIALLKCTSAYPAAPEDMNLRSIPDMAARFGVPVGLSDHTMTTAVPAAAVSLGACIVEKHLTLSRDDPGPDSGFSLEPHEFKEMAAAVRTVEAALGRVVYGPSLHEQSSLIFRRSLFVVKAMSAGELFTRDNVKSIRPGTGMHPRNLDWIIGRRATSAIARGTPLEPHLVADPGPDPQGGS